MAHQAKQVEFGVLYENLKAESQRGNVVKIERGSLSLFTYTNRCVYERAWNKWNVLARGLILDIPRAEVHSLRESPKGTPPHSRNSSTTERWVLSRPTNHSMSTKNSMAA
jgi:hypothetical protein